MNGAHASPDRLFALRQSLADLQAEFADRPDLYKIYSQPTLFELSILQQEIREALADADPEVDFWVGLRGDGFGSGSGPADVVASFLRNLRVGVRHAASALQRLSYSGGRFGKEIENATAFRLVATAPGSLQIGLSAPDVINKYDPMPETLSIDVFTTAIAAQAKAHSLCIDATKILIDALEAPSSEDTLRRLRDNLGDDGTLRVLYYARSLFLHGVRSIEFHGNSLGRSVTYDSSVREGIKRIGDELVRTERYVSGTGVIRMLDLVKHTLRLEFTRIESFPGVEILQGEYDPHIGPVANLMEQPVEFSGWLTFDLAGEPQKIRVDSLETTAPAISESAQLIM